MENFRSSQNPLKQTFTQDASADTPEGGIHRVGGRHIRKIITLSANNTTAAVNVYQITGTVKIFNIHCEVVDATTLVNCTGVSISLNDDAVSRPITLATGSIISGMAAGSILIRQDDATNAISVADNATAVVTESLSPAKALRPFFVTQKNGTDTFIVFNYATTDAPINAQIQVDVEYALIDSGTIADA